MTSATRAEAAETKNIGLRGVVVADSTISKVDGERGILIYRGYDIGLLARESNFEEVVHLLLAGELPKAAELAALRQELADYRELPAAVIAALRTLPRQAVPMDVLQAAVPLLAMHDPEATSDPGGTQKLPPTPSCKRLQGAPDARQRPASYTEVCEQASNKAGKRACETPDGVPCDRLRAACRRQALRLSSQLPLLVSTWERLRRGREPVAARAELTLAENFLYTMDGELPEPRRAACLDTVLVLHADHGFNASTFTARQIASTRAHLYAAIGGALGSLSGELHGGANERVFHMLQAIGAKERVADYVSQALDRGERIMGMGHTVYRVTDPRAEILGPMAAKLAEQAGHPELYRIAEELRRVTTAEIKRRKGREIYANVDFFSAIVNAMLGIPVDLFTPLFAMGRISGWCAHYLEERFGGAHARPTIYRPQAEYIGRYCGLEGCTWTPIDKR